MPDSPKPVTILIAEDDPDDRKMVKDAFDEARLGNEIVFVEDGVEVLDYLNRRGRFTDPLTSPWPSLLLLDLNMPRMDGRDVMRALHNDPRYLGLRVIVMTTSRAEEDIVSSYSLCAASFITKPVTFESLVEVVRTLGRYWLEIVELPDNEPSRYEPPAARP